MDRARRVAPGMMPALPDPAKPGGVLLGLSGGDVALVVLAAFWGVLVLFLAVVLLMTFRVLDSTRLLIDGIREQTVPLLGEVKTTVVSVNRELDRVDTVMESAGKMSKAAERITIAVEHAVSNPLVKFAAFGAGASAALKRLRGEK